MTITNAEIKKISKLAKIELADQEIESLKKDLDNILQMVDLLKTGDTDNVDFITSVIEEDLPKRKDEAIQQNIVEELKQNAPHFELDFFIAPKVVDND